MNRIEINPMVFSGKPVIQGTRIPVSLILNLLAKAYTFDAILKAYPELKVEDIQAAIEFGARLADYEEIGLLDEITHES